MRLRKWSAWPISFLLLAVYGNALSFEMFDGGGKSYPVIETSRSETILKKIRAAKKNQKNPIDPEKKWVVRLAHPPKPVKQDATRSVDISVTLPFDITDAQGQVIYPKGYRYNPLDHYLPGVQMTSLVVIDGENDEQVQWARKIRQVIRGRVKIVISRGSFLKLKREQNLRVFHLDDELMNRFQIERIPCTVIQKGSELEIHEYAL